MWRIEFVCYLIYCDEKNIVLFSCYFLRRGGFNIDEEKYYNFKFREIIK